MNIKMRLKKKSNYKQRPKPVPKPLIHQEIKIISPNMKTSKEPEGEDW